MKKLIVLFVLLSLVSCQEEIASYDSLTDAERTTLDNMSSTKCATDSEDEFALFKESSTGVFTNPNYARGNGFEFVLKNGSTTFKTVTITVWKQEADKIYFAISDPYASPKNYFLLMTKTENDQMIDTLKTRLCERPSKYSMGITSSSLSATFEAGNSVKDQTNTNNYKDTYTMYFNELALFATYRVTRTKKVLDQDGNQVGNTESYTSTIADKDTVFKSNTPSDFATVYCTVPTPYAFISTDNFQGFYDPTKACSGTLPGGWDLAVP